MYQFKVTLVKQSRKADPKTGRKKRTKRVISDIKPIKFDVKINRDEKEKKDMKINLNNINSHDDNYDFKVKIHKGDEINESSTSTFRDNKEDEFQFKPRIMKSVPNERSEMEVNHDPVMSTIQLNSECEFEPDCNPEPDFIPSVSEETQEYGEPEEDIIPFEDDINEDNITEDNEISEEEEEEIEYLPDDADEIEDEEEDIEEILEEEEEEVSKELEDAGIDESVFETVTINGEVLNAVELTPEEEIEEFQDDVPPYEEEEDYLLEDMIPSKYKKKVSSKKNKKKQIENEY